MKHRIILRKNRNLFFKLLDAKRSSIMALPTPLTREYLPCLSSHGRRMKREPLSVRFCKALITLYRENWDARTILRENKMIWYKFLSLQKFFYICICPCPPLLYLVLKEARSRAGDLVIGDRDLGARKLIKCS